MISGYLSPDGTFYNAPYQSHLSTAQRIVEDHDWFSDNKKDWPEDILLKRVLSVFVLVICIKERVMIKELFQI